MRIEALTDLLWRSLRAGVHDPVELQGRLSIDEGYAVQLGLIDRYVEAGDALVGWKVGLTAKAIQAQVGYHEPVLGFLLASGHRPSGALLVHDELIRPRFENELCLTIGETLRGPGVTSAQARAAIAQVAPAFEIVEQRQGPASGLGLVLADHCQNKAFVTGAPVPLGDRDLAAVTVEVVVNGVLQERALGVEVLGEGPVASVAWLANKLAGFGRALEAGSRVMSGSFTRQYELGAGDSVEARFAAIGSVTARVV